MKRLKIYLDTSVISHLDQQDAPEKMSDTLKLWDDIKLGLYDVYISDVALDEIYKCSQTKLAILEKYLAEIEYNYVIADNEVLELAEHFISNHILTTKSIEDCRHIACSMIQECDVIVSWNFKHIVNHKTIKGVKLVSVMTGYDEVAIYTPTFLTGGERVE